MAGDLQEIQRFNFVLMSRSIDVDDAKNNSEQLQMMNQQVPEQHMQSVQHPPASH